jgi:hypothetical protein
MSASDDLQWALPWVVLSPRRSRTAGMLEEAAYLRLGARVLETATRRGCPSWLEPGPGTTRVVRRSEAQAGCGASESLEPARRQTTTLQPTHGKLVQVLAAHIVIWKRPASLLPRRHGAFDRQTPRHGY